MLTDRLTYATDRQRERFEGIGEQMSKNMEGKTALLRAARSAIGAAIVSAGLRTGANWGHSLHDRCRRRPTSVVRRLNTLAERRRHSGGRRPMPTRF